MLHLSVAITNTGAIKSLNKSLTNTNDVFATYRISCDIAKCHICSDTYRHVCMFLYGLHDNNFNI